MGRIITDENKSIRSDFNATIFVHFHVTGYSFKWFATFHFSFENFKSPLMSETGIAFRPDILSESIIYTESKTNTLLHLPFITHSLRKFLCLTLLTGTLQEMPLE